MNQFQLRVMKVNHGYYFEKVVESNKNLGKTRGLYQGRKRKLQADQAAKAVFTFLLSGQKCNTNVLS